MFRGGMAVRGRRRINLGKAAVFAIIINTLQILLVFFFLFSLPKLVI